MVKIKQDLVDKIAEMEVDALIEGLHDPELRRNPAFLEKVRKFLAQNNLKTTPETPGVAQLQKVTEEIPTFEDLQ
ncbi:MAG: hypothetical protein DBY32_11210 [Phascolarctobacterium sp.]|nr:MAG: hypothetical protein DBY32_11210 [Phascolarctobacterium sp.]